MHKQGRFPVSFMLGISAWLCVMIGCLPPPGHAASRDSNGYVPDKGGKIVDPTPQRQKATVRTQATEFTLSDQYNHTHHYRFPRDRASVLLIADYAGSGQLEDWVRLIYGRYQDHVAIEGVAELSVIPRFARGVIKTFFRGQLDYPVMLDWSGDVTSQYAYQPGEANLFVIDQNGDIVLKVIGAVDDTKLHHVLATLGRLLDRQANGQHTTPIKKGIPHASP